MKLSDGDWARFGALGAGRGLSAEAALLEAAELGLVFLELEEVVRGRWDAELGGSYVAGLLRGPEDGLLKKLSEEAAEAGLAAKGGDAAGLARETADLWFHCVVALARYNTGVRAVAEVLSARAGTSGLAEKSARQGKN